MKLREAFPLINQVKHFLSSFLPVLRCSPIQEWKSCVLFFHKTTNRSFWIRLSGSGKASSSARQEERAPRDFHFNFRNSSNFAV